MRANLHRHHRVFTGGDSGTQTPSDNTGTAGDSASGDVGDNGQFLNWLLNNGGTGR